MDEATLNKLPESLKARIARASRNKGSNYEREVAKKIAAYFGWKWDSCFYRTKPHGMAQPNGDIQPINEMNDLWRQAKLGPLECKSRKEWSFDNLFKSPKDSYIYKYWKKSEDDTGNRGNTVLAFTKPAVSDMVMTVNRSVIPEQTALHFKVGTDYFMIQTLKSFLMDTWPKEG